MLSPVSRPLLGCLLCALSACDQPAPPTDTEAKAPRPSPPPPAAEAAAEDDQEAVYQQASQLLEQTNQPAAVALGVAMMRTAADAGHTKAQSVVGFHLAQGEKKDLPAAVGYLSQAALAGDRFAAQNLRRLHDKFLEDQPQEKPKVVAALRQASEQGSPIAAAELGSMYYLGSSNLAQDYGQALPLLRQAAAGGNIDAANTLGAVYMHGQGVEMDKKEAAKFFAQAAAAGHVKAQASLGLAYAVGNGVPSDRVQAFKWLRLSSRAGEATGQNALADFIRGLSKDQIREGHRQVAEFLRARGENVTAEQLDDEIFNVKLPTLEDLQKEMPKPSATPTPDDRA